jgi:hypothetical protein
MAYVICRICLAVLCGRNLNANKALCVICCSCALAAALPLHAQVAGGTISGTMRDRSGALIPNVSLSMADVATGVTRVVASNDRGLYPAPNLVPGTYQVTATANGLATTVTKGDHGRRRRRADRRPRDRSGESRAEH